MKKNEKNRTSTRANKFLTLARKDAITGYLFILPFIIGFVAFMLIPIVQSIMMSFSEVLFDLENNGFIMNFNGLDNLNNVFFIDPDFVPQMVAELGRMAMMVPAIIVFAFSVAVLINQKFKGRLFVRAVFFLPVILASGVIVGIEADNALLGNVAELIRESNAVRAQVTGTLEEVLATATGGMGLINDFMEIVFVVINQIHIIAMASGIQIIIFLTGLQLIPTSLYEASRIEGATEWENFWKITFPMLSPMILVNIVYSVIDFLIRTDNEVMDHINRIMIADMNYGLGSAMAWVYFLIVSAVLGIVGFLVSRKIYYYE